MEKSSMTFGFEALHHMISGQQVSPASICCEAGASMHNILARVDRYDREQLYEYKLRVPGVIVVGRRGIHLFRTLRVISHATRKVPSIF